MQFVDLGLMEPLLRSIAEQGYETATPIQAQTIPHTLAGRDVLGAAQTGTGKTAAFALPVLHRLFSDKLRGPRNIRCLVLCPTRELALQIAESFDTYLPGPYAVAVSILLSCWRDTGQTYDGRRCVCSESSGGR